MENDGFVLNRNSDVKVTYIGTGQFRLASGKWVDAILYEYKGVYKMMEASEFIKLAEPDRSTTLDMVGDTIGHRYKPRDDKNENQKTVTEMVQDWLGPGYVPGFGSDLTNIPAYEVKCTDCVQDDGQWYVAEDDKNEDSNRA